MGQMVRCLLCCVIYSIDNSQFVLVVFAPYLLVVLLFNSVLELPQWIMLDLRFCWDCFYTTCHHCESWRSKLIMDSTFHTLYSLFVVQKYCNYCIHSGPSIHKEVICFLTNIVGICCISIFFAYGNCRSWICNFSRLHKSCSQLSNNCQIFRIVCL